MCLLKGLCHFCGDNSPVGHALSGYSWVMEYLSVPSGESISPELLLNSIQDLGYGEVLTEVEPPIGDGDRYLEGEEEWVKYSGTITQEEGKSDKAMR